MFPNLRVQRQRSEIQSRFMTAAEEDRYKALFAGLGKRGLQSLFDKKMQDVLGEGLLTRKGRHYGRPNPNPKPAYRQARHGRVRTA